MESQSGPFESEQNIGDEVLRQKRREMLDLAHDALKKASSKTERHEGVYLSREPLAIGGHEDAFSLLLTRDGERPFVDEWEDKEYIKLFFIPDYEQYLQDELYEAEKSVVWVEEHSQNNQRQYVLTEHGFQPYAAKIDDLREDFYSISSKPEMGELRRFHERLDRFKLTPFKEVTRSNDEDRED